MDLAVFQVAGSALAVVIEPLSRLSTAGEDAAVLSQEHRVVEATGHLRHARHVQPLEAVEEVGRHQLLPLLGHVLRVLSLAAAEARSVLGQQNAMLETRRFD